MTDPSAYIRRREPIAEGGQSRDLSYPPLPEALVVPVYDNHAHLEIEDGPGPVAEPGEENSVDAKRGEGRGPAGAATGPLSYTDHLDRASAVGVRGVVQASGDLETSRWTAEVVAREPRMLGAVAIHPNEAPRYAAAGQLDDAMSELAELAARPRVRAIGETGLDAFRTGDDGRGAQRRFFEAHIALAKETGLALQIHDRDAHRDVVETLDRVGAPERTVFHCFSGDAELAQILADHGWYASFSGNVTFKNAHDLRDALEVMPRNRILVETDSPFLTPHPFRGRPNSPYLIPLTLRAMAATLGTDVSMLAAQISSTTEAVYGTWNSEPVTVLE